ncbi:MAG: 3'-5' exonuclease [Chloroflexota bacterium]|nr:3'-5' exonuclease [Chloroflexota bacterium]
MTEQLATPQSELDEETRPLEDTDPGIVYLTKEEAEDLFDRQARKYLGMSGVEFRRQYQAGTIDDPCRTDVIRVSYLMYMADE